MFESEGEKRGGNFPHGKDLEQRWLKVFRESSSSARPGSPTREP